MIERDSAAGYGRTSVVLSWLVVISFAVTFSVAVSFPLMDVGDPERDFRRALHMTLGLAVAIFILARLVWWCINPKPQPPAGMPANAYGLSRVTTCFLYLDLLGLAVSGLMNSWSMAYEVSVFGLFILPAWHGWSTALAGYLHSLFLFFNNFMLLAFIVVNLYHALRYKTGFRRFLPGPQA